MGCLIKNERPVCIWKIKNWTNVQKKQKQTNSIGIGPSGQLVHQGNTLCARWPVQSSPAPAPTTNPPRRLLSHTHMPLTHMGPSWCVAAVWLSTSHNNMLETFQRNRFTSKSIQLKSSRKKGVYQSENPHVLFFYKSLCLSSVVALKPQCYKVLSC